MKKRVATLMVAVSLVLSFALFWLTAAAVVRGGATAATTGTITGKVSNNANGAAIAGATVTDGVTTVITGTDGTFTMSGVSPGIAESTYYFRVEFRVHLEGRGRDRGKYKQGRRSPAAGCGVNNDRQPRHSPDPDVPGHLHRSTFRRTV